jgi:predicted nucleic acid-binding protein
MRRPWTATAARQCAAAWLASPGLGAPATGLLTRLPGIAGNLLRDAHAAVLMREHGVRQIGTRDAAFQRFPLREIVDPPRR